MIAEDILMADSMNARYLIAATLAEDEVEQSPLGIEEGIIGKIFDPFFTTKTTAEASGVGLYLSREIVQNHGGDIQVKSQKNEYTEFIITLPVRKS